MREKYKLEIDVCPLHYMHVTCQEARNNRNNQFIRPNVASKN